MNDPATAHARMVDRLIEAGSLRADPWVRAFRAVPRHPFLPRFFWQNPAGDWGAVEADDPDWIDRAYTVTSIVTQLDNDPGAWAQARRTPRSGVPTSSSSDPGLMAAMLEALDVHDGHRVLEIGTGTGYNAALLAERLGDDQVVSVEVDSDIAAMARRAANSIGYAPTIVTGDGRAGVPDRAPYDRIIATASAPTVPAAWIRQARPGGRIMLNLYAELGGGALALLTVDGDRAEGRFLAQYGDFMPTRDAQPARTTHDRFNTALRDPEGDRGRANLPNGALDDLDFAMLAALLVPHVGWIKFTPYGEPEQLWLLGDGGSWAMIDAAGVSEQRGQRRIADELAATYQTWDRFGRPSRDRFGLTVDTSGYHSLWLDQPRQPIRQAA